MSEVEFELRKLSDLIEIYNNKRVPLSAKQREGLEKIYPYYGAQGIVDYVDDYIFDGKYILIAEDGENLKSNNKSICTLATGKYWVNNHAHIIKGNDETNTDFLYYKLNSISFAPYITGSAQPKLNKENLLNIEIYIPSRKYQDKIARVLALLDHKIQTNNQINQELEAMAKTLYDYWFVQFDFPDQNGKPYKSSGGKMVYNLELKREIPEGWGVTKVGELQIATGKRDANFGTENGKYDFWTTANSPIKADEFSFEGKAILIAGNGNFYVNFTEGKFEAYQRTYVIQSEDENMLIFMYMACLQSVEKLRKGSNGSIIKYITIGDVNNIASPYNKNVVNEFVRIYSPLIDLISKNKRQNQELTQLRDWLLPMLMNGQVKVE
ncbi:Type I restriction-modification system DNA methylase [Streptococcus cristatus]|uniref:Type I restriction modification DNA specificity domain-containing protein n=2 Tax=Streptococcus cristatus TaxID=45634 RepID=A0A512ABX3_STRCR|nr:restriction endonuclease subunit S [Streptococcus cristatus]AGK70350.1 Type I restriction-modification system DNA methylase [Streptococcus cristatus AS 1.3089]GEN97215.1 hypothetical protein SOL01_10890 [Streptococcus cristatus]SQI45555.1 Type I restriction-modification system DNA methylase [Streptococcus cristatus]